MNSGAILTVMSDDLTPKQRKFVEEYLSNGENATQAYRAAYTCENWRPETVAREGWNSLQNPKITAIINEARKVDTDRILFTVKMLMQRFVDIASTDPNELIRIRVGCCRHCYGDNHLFQWREHEYMQALAKAEASKGDTPLPEIGGGFGFNHTLDPVLTCDNCHGEGVERVIPMDTTKLSPGARHLYRGVQRTKDGIKILFANQDKALEQLGRMLGAFDDRLRVAGELNSRVEALTLTTTDPNEAARAYKKFLDGG